MSTLCLNQTGKWQPTVVYVICTRLHTLLECLPLNIGAFVALGFTIVREGSGSTMLKTWLRRMWKLRLSPDAEAKHQPKQGRHLAGV